MSSDASRQLLSRAIAWFPFAASAVSVSLIVHWSMDRPWLGGVFGVLALLFLLPNWLLRRRLKRVFLSADLAEVLETVDDLLENSSSSGSASLVRATTLLAYGRLDEAERLARYVPRDLRHEDDEQWLVFQILLDSYIGERERALKRAQSLLALPLPLSPWTRQHSRLMREGMAALARAFARIPERGDLRRLANAADDEPLLVWPLRYAQAIVLIEQGEAARAAVVLGSVPAWPKESAFGDIQRELAGRVLSQRPTDVESPAPSRG